jgi:hypothetical protein
MTLPEETILADIGPGNQNHFVFRNNFEDFPTPRRWSFR